MLLPKLKLIPIQADSIKCNIMVSHSLEFLVFLTVSDNDEVPDEVLTVPE